MRAQENVLEAAANQAKNDASLQEGLFFITVRAAHTHS